MTAEPRPFCPTCLQTANYYDESVFRSRWSALPGRRPGLNPWAHRGWSPQEKRVRPHRVRIRGGLRIRAIVHHTGRTTPAGFGRVMGRTWISCPDPWHNETPPAPDPRPGTERPTKAEQKARRKARARRHKERQAKR